VREDTSIPENGRPEAGERPWFATTRSKVYLLVGLGLIHLIISWFAIVPGYLLIDEACYHWMTRDFATTGTLELWNGYSELPSIELSHRHLPVSKGRVVPRWPYLFPIISLPFYWGLGFYGLFVVNALAFIGVVFLCFASAMKLFGDDNLALNSCLIFIFATFAWEYSQAAWPHMTALLFIMVSFYLGMSAYYAQSTRTALWLGFAAGLVGGIAPGVRLDSLLALPAVVLPFLFARPARFRETAAVLLGTVPGLTILAATNYVKFGVFTPVSYGPGSGLPYRLLIAAGVVTGLVWVMTRPFCADFVRKRKILLISAALAFLLAVSLMPQGRAFLKTTLLQGFVSVVDVRALHPADELPSLDRSSGGGMIYIGAHKKALLQSLPYLALLIVPLAAVWRRDPYFAELCILFIVPVSFVGYYSCEPHEYGGMSLNFRYYLAGLPFASILCAYALRRLKREWGLPFGLPVIACIAILTGCGFFYLTYRPGVTLDNLEFPLLIVPQIMFLFLAFLLVAGHLIRTEGSRPLRGAAWVLLIVSMTWAGLLAFFYDYPNHRGARAGNYWLETTAMARIPPDSLFFSQPYLSPSLIEGDRIRIAFPAMDRGKDLPKLAKFNLEHGRRVFAALPLMWWQRLIKGPLRNYKVRKIQSLPGVVLAEISSPPKEKKGKGEEEGPTRRGSPTKPGGRGGPSKDSVFGRDPVW
jgi:hypothetical protein